MQTDTNKSFLIRIDSDKSKYLETHSFEIDRISDIVARLISKNLRFDSAGVASRFNKLIELCKEYDEAKTSVSDDIVIPKATEAWGKYSNIAWSLNFKTCDITVTYNGTTYQKKYEDIAEVPSDMIDVLRDASTKNLAFIEVHDKIIQQYPVIDTESYTEFITNMKEYDNRFTDTKAIINNDIVMSYLKEHGISPERCNWNLNYATAKIALYENVNSEEEAE